MELQSVVGTSCASPEWTIHIVPDTFRGSVKCRFDELMKIIAALREVSQFGNFDIIKDGNQELFGQQFNGRRHCDKLIAKGKAKAVCELTNDGGSTSSGPSHRREFSEYETLI
jgi:hypothetical protein